MIGVLQVRVMARAVARTILYLNEILYESVAHGQPMSRDFLSRVLG